MTERPVGKAYVLEGAMRILGAEHGRNSIMAVASCRRLEVDESMNAVRECKATAEEDSWSGLNQVRERVRKNQPRRLEKPRRGVERETREIRQDFEKSEAGSWELFF